MRGPEPSGSSQQDAGVRETPLALLVVRRVPGGGPDPRTPNNDQDPPTLGGGWALGAGRWAF